MSRVSINTLPELSADLLARLQWLPLLSKLCDPKCSKESIAESKSRKVKAQEDILGLGPKRAKTKFRKNLLTYSCSIRLLVIASKEGSS